jgi:glycerol-3-phosphate acyltransferase PlsY
MSVTFSIWLRSFGIVTAAYLLGSIPTGYLLVRFFRKQDIRTLGSGNIGATNVMRSGAKGLGAATFLLDALKGVAAVFVGLWIAKLHVPYIHPHEAAALAALCAVLGHMFPIWLGLRGGKGVATAFGVFLVVAPKPALCCLAVFVLVFAISRFVSLASILGAATFPIFAWFLEPWVRLMPVVLVITCMVSALIIGKHHQNIRRLAAGTEYRFGAKKKADQAGIPAAEDAESGASTKDTQ